VGRSEHRGNLRLFLTYDHAAVRLDLRWLLEQQGGVICGEAGLKWG